jgi:Tol biopolymer transport system component
MFGTGRSKLLTAAGVAAVTAALATTGATPAGATPAPAAPVQVCLAPGGAQPDRASYPDGLSADGRTVLFDSSATNLVPGGNNGKGGVFACDLRSGRIERADVSDSGAQPDSYSYGGAISADGRYVVFTSAAGNLVPGATAGVENVYLRDLRRHHTELISASTGSGPQVGGSSQPAVSADGRYVAFSSNRADLVPGDTNSAADVFVRDRRTGSTVLVSVHSDGAPAAAGSFRPSISADGSRVVFTSRDRGLASSAAKPAAAAAAEQDAAPRKARFYPLFEHDLRTGRTEVASAEPDGTTADVTDGVISADGRHVEFTSLDNNYRAPSQVMVRDLDRGTTTVVSTAPDGTAGNQDSRLVGLSPSGRWSLFSSTADNLLPGGTPGRSTGFYLRDLRTGRTQRLLGVPDLANTGTEVTGSAVDAAGRTLLFGAAGSSVLPGSTDQIPQLFTLRLPRH